MTRKTTRNTKTCPCCERDRVGPIKTWDRITAYQNPELNRLTACVHCIREDDAYFAEMWADYYAGQGYPRQVEVPHRNGRRRLYRPRAFA